MQHSKKDLFVIIGLKSDREIRPSELPFDGRRPGPGAMAGIQKCNFVSQILAFSGPFRSKCICLIRSQFYNKNEPNKLQKSKEIANKNSIFEFPPLLPDRKRVRRMAVRWARFAVRF